MTPLPLVFAALLAVTPPPELPAQGVYALSDPGFVAQAQSDLEALRRYAQGMRKLQAQIQTQRSLFTAKQKDLYSPEQKQVLLTTWGALYDYVFSAEVLRQRYWDFVTLPLGEAHDLKRMWGFLLTHGALTTQLAHGLTFADLVAGNPQLEVLFDEPSNEFGVPPRAFERFKLQVIHVSTTTQLMTGDTYGQQQRKRLGSLKLVDRPDVVWLLEEIKQNSKVARGKLLKRGAKLFSSSALDWTKDSTLTALFPVQKGVAEWMGDTKTHRLGQPLISRAQILELLKKMEPGDVIVARQNWFLSNIGLPGFWPHAEIYLGRPEEWTAYFDADPALLAFLSKQPGAPKTLAAYLEAAYPAKWKQYLGNDEHGDPLRIIESISEGVSLTGVEHGMRVDYLGVMRPRLSKLEKAQSFIRAFAYQGRPYDFDFDFFSDSSLVCTELVFKCYLPSADMTGLKLPLVNVAGRMTLPANDIVKRFDEELDQKTRQLDFVAFLDGREDKKDAVSADVTVFRKSHQRMKWDIAQK